jgi:hypothetical protein
MTGERLLILNFDGVIGDFYSPSIWRSETFGLYLRPNAISTLENLSDKHQIAIMFSCEAAKADHALRHLRKMEVQIDAAYVVTQTSLRNFPVVYDQIYTDFCITDGLASKVLVTIIHHYYLDCRKLCMR